MIFRSTMCGMDNKKLTNELDNASEEDSEMKGKPKYDRFDAEAEITKDFKFSVGMEFTSGQQFKDVVRELNVLNGRKIKFARNLKKSVRAVCKFNQRCAYNVFASIAKKTNTFWVRSLRPMHTCGMDNKKLTNELDNASKEDSETNGQPKYDKFNAEAEITKDFKFSIGMEFTSKQQFKDVVRELNVLNGRKIKFATIEKRRVKAVCKFNQKCGYNVCVCIVRSKETYRVTSLCPTHTCGMVFNFKSSRSKWVAEVLVKHNIKQEPKKRGMPKVNTLSNVKTNEAAKRKTKRRRDACYKKTEELDQQQLEVLVDGEPLNQNQEVSADDDMLAKNTFVEPISAMNHVPSAADPNPVTSFEKKRKKKVTRKLDLKKVRRTSNRLRTLAFKKVYDGPGSDKSRPIVINDDDYDDDDDDDDNELNDPKVGSCMHALRNWDGIYQKLEKISFLVL